MGVASGAHALHDGYTDLIYVMLPIWQAEFGLSYAAIGLLRGVFAGTMAGFQIPAGLLSERLGTPLVLAAGTALAGFGYCLAPFVGSYPALIAILLIAGLGASTQHPLASALVARAFAGTRSLSRARHLQFRRRSRKDGAARRGFAAGGGDAVAAVARDPRRARARGGARDSGADAALSAGKRGASPRRRSTPQAGSRPADFPCCCRSA